MPDETTKAILRRRRDPRFAERFFVGAGIDIGAGKDSLGEWMDEFPRMLSCYAWDKKDGDAMLMQGVPSKSYDFVHSSHCLEHLRAPWLALQQWWRILKVGGHLVVIVPDEDLYEQGVFPSTFNPDHKWTFTIQKVLRDVSVKGAPSDTPLEGYVSQATSWSPRSLDCFDLIGFLGFDVETLKVELLDEDYDYTAPRHDQTGGRAACAIEFILRKRPQHEVDAGGRFR